MFIVFMHSYLTKLNIDSTIELLSDLVKAITCTKYKIYIYSQNFISSNTHTPQEKRVKRNKRKPGKRKVIMHCHGS